MSRRVQLSPKAVIASLASALIAAVAIPTAAIARDLTDSATAGERRAEIGERAVAPRAAREPKAIELLLEEAEAAYRDGRWSPAIDAFKAVIAVDPGNARAWLRVGNLHHRRGQWLPAASAYRKAADRADGDQAGLRLRALLNLASVNLELANLALSQAESEPDDPAVPAGHRQALQQQLHRARLRHDERALDAIPEAREPSTERLPAIEYLRGAPQP